MKINYQPCGTCSKAIEIDVEEGIVKNVKFVGGCAGNTGGISALVKGMKAAEVAEKLRGIQCGTKGTSYPDQLAKALSQIVE